ncbi:MAG: GPI anchored serine-threonine rich family protein [Blastocatellia bacterium]|nr:GPI anchored serine-threonine rich family protein [Blastocatellia bacterium]
MFQKKLFHLSIFLACVFLAFLFSMQRGCREVVSQVATPDFSQQIPVSATSEALPGLVQVESGPALDRGVLPQAEEELKTDDGTVESGVVGDNLIVVNRLTPATYPVTVERVRIRWDAYQNLPSPIGKTVRLLVFTDPSGSGRPVTPVSYNVNQPVTISQVGLFLDFTISPILLSAGDVYVGFQAPNPAQGVGFSADTGSQPQQRAFFSTNQGTTFQGPLQFQDGTKPNILMRAVVATTTTGDSEELKTDDGTADGRGFLENNMMMVNRLTPSRYPATLEKIRIYFVSFQGQPNPVGATTRLVVYLEPQGTGNPPVNAQPALSQTVTIPGTGSFMDFAVSPLVISAGDVYVGYQAGNPANGVGFAVDSNGPSQHRGFYSQNNGANFLGPLQFSDGTSANLLIRAVVRAGSSGDSQSPTVTVLAPNGGETVQLGAVTQVRWTSSDNTGVVKHDVWLSLTGGDSYPLPVASGLAGTAQSYQWTVSGSSTALARVKVMAFDAAGNSGFDTSNENFAISSGSGDVQSPTVQVLSPNGGEQLVAGTTVRIAWTSTDNIGLAMHNLALSTDGGSTFPLVIATGLPATAKEFFWSVPLVETQRGRVKVSAFDTSSNEGFDLSDRDFQITATSTGDFTLTAAPTSLNLSAGESGPVLIAAAGTAGFQNPVALNATVSPADANVRVTFQENPLRIGSSTTATVSLTDPLATSSYTITLTGSSGGKTHSVEVALGIWKAIASKPVGSEGGTISAAGFKLKIPANALSESSQVTVSESPAAPFDAASKQYRITGLTPFTKNLKMTIPMTKPASGSENYAAITCLSASVTAGPSRMEPTWVSAKVSGTTATVTLPAMEAETASGQTEEAAWAPPDRAAFGESVKEFFANMVDTTAWYYVDSSNNHFKMTYRHTGNESRVTQLAANLEDAYKTLESVGLTWAGRTKWPIRVCVGEFKDPKEKEEMWGYEITPSLWGVNYAYIGLNEDKLNAPNNETEFKSTVAHELFHVLQETYVRSTVVREDAYYWMREACSVWIERKMLPAVCPSVLGNSDSVKFPTVGVGMMEYKQSQDHGYGASMFLSFLTNSYKDDQIIGRIWDNAKKKYSPVAALGAATNDATWAQKWLQFANAYFTGVNADRCWPPANSTQIWGETWNLTSTANQTHTFSPTVKGLCAIPLRVKVLTGGFRADQKITLTYKPGSTSSVVSIFKIQGGATTLLGNITQSLTIEPITDFESNKTTLLCLVVSDAISGNGAASLEVKLEGTNQDVTYAMKPFTKVSDVWSPSVWGQRKGRIMLKGTMTGPNLNLATDHVLWPTDENLATHEVQTYVSGKGDSLPLGITYQVDSFEVDGATAAENQNRSWTTTQVFPSGGREVSVITFTGYRLYDRYGIDILAESSGGTFNLTVANKTREEARYRLDLVFTVSRETFDKDGKKTGSSGPAPLRENVLWFEFEVR